MSTDPEEMKNRALELAQSLRSVVTHIESISRPSQPVRLVAVSKLKPASDVTALYDTGHRHFGENYVQELLEKAEKLPKDIDWHFIGTLQTNKCNLLAKIPNLWAIESMDAIKKATQLEKARAALTASSPEVPKLRVFVQINTSGEENKSGCQPSEAIEVCRYVLEKCPHLTLQGLMTIGAIARSKDPENENEDFITLAKVRDEVEKELRHKLELSMGMSSDYEQAIKLGASNVRVGTTIFGYRPPKQSP